MMDTRQDAGGRSPTLAARLRREARAMRPGFSTAFHERLMERIASDIENPAESHEVSPTLSVGARVMLSLLGAGVVAAAVALLVTRGITADGLDGGTPAEISVASLHGAPATVSIEALPMYDDIDASMRNGVWMLAATLVEVPDWVRLADFDAPGTAVDTARP